MANKTKVYSDVDLTFGIHPLNNDITMLYDETAVIRSMKHIILSNYGDFKFHPERDVGIRDLLFENLNVITESMLQKRIEIILSQNVSRVKVNSVDVKANEVNDGFNVEITFTTLNLIEPITTTLFLQRIR